MTIMDCGHEVEDHKYGKTKNGKKLCYECCGKQDLERLKTDTVATLYLDESEATPAVTNWPGTLRIPVRRHRRSWHNIARTRTDVWFSGPDGREWHGVQLGDWSQICRCKKLKK